MEKSDLYEKIHTARQKRFLTNCYSMDVVENCKEVWSRGEEFMFSYDDHGVQRLVYFAKTWGAVDLLLEQLKCGHFFLEFMTKNPEEYIPYATEMTAAMMRLANPECYRVFEEDSPVIQYKDFVAAEKATERDTEEINYILWSTFKTEVSHLLSNDELKDKIQDGQISVHRDAEGHIDAILQADVMPKRFYINQIVNRASREVIHAILLYRLEEYIKLGGKYLYAWVDSKNVASLKFHKKYGMEHDGMWSMIYSIDR